MFSRGKAIRKAGDRPEEKRVQRNRTLHFLSFELAKLKQ